MLRWIYETDKAVVVMEKPHFEMQSDSDKTEMEVEMPYSVYDSNKKLCDLFSHRFDTHFEDTLLNCCIHPFYHCCQNSYFSQKICVLVVNKTQPGWMVVVHQIE